MVVKSCGLNKGSESDSQLSKASPLFVTLNTVLVFEGRSAIFFVFPKYRKIVYFLFITVEKKSTRPTSINPA